jgi:hypothetical protein
MADDTSSTDASTTTDDDTATTGASASSTGGAGTTGTQELGDGGKKALEAERTRAKAAERRAKTAETALETERAKGLSDSERAIAEAKAEGRREAATDAGKRLARAEIRAAAAASGLKVTADDLDDLDMSKFLGDDGEPDDAAIATRIKRWQALAPESTRPRGSIDQGNRGGAAPTTPADQFAQILQGHLKT